MAQKVVPGAASAALASDGGPLVGTEDGADDERAGEQSLPLGELGRAARHFRVRTEPFQSVAAPFPSAAPDVICGPAALTPRAGGFASRGEALGAERDSSFRQAKRNVSQGMA